MDGGSFSGDDIRGDVLPGDADYQDVRADEVVATEAVYMIRTDGRALINVVNKHIFISSISTRPEQPGRVFIRVYKVL